MAITDWAFMGLVVVGFVGLLMKARREHREALLQRGRLLDRVPGLFIDSRISIGADSFPVLIGHLPDLRLIKIEIIADTLVCRRLPQLWLMLTIGEPGRLQRSSIGALARPTGAEFYSHVHDLPDRIEAPPWGGSAMLVRGNGASQRQLENVSGVFRRCFSDPAFKEAVVGPQGVRLIRQAAEGDRGAHMLFRQIRFTLRSVSPDLIRTMVAQAEDLRHALSSGDAKSHDMAIPTSVM